VFGSRLQLTQLQDKLRHQQPLLLTLRLVIILPTSRQLPILLIPNLENILFRSVSTPSIDLLILIIRPFLGYSYCLVGCVETDVVGSAEEGLPGWEFDDGEDGGTRHVTPLLVEFVEDGDNQLPELDLQLVVAFENIGDCEDC